MRSRINVLLLSVLAVFSLVSISYGAGGASDNTSAPAYPPKDRIDVSDGFHWEMEFGISDYELTILYLRTGIKKGKIGIWYKNIFTEIYYLSKGLRDDTPDDIKQALVDEFESIKQKLKDRAAAGANDWVGAPDVALFIDGFHKASTSLLLKFEEPVTFLKYSFEPSVIVEDHPIMIIPTAGFFELSASTKLRDKLEEYVRLGGTLIAFGQEQGGDWAPLPNPDKRKGGPIAGLGYTEDLSATKKSVYIDTYHQILSGFTSSFADVGVDGYFTAYPKGSKVLLRKTDNDKPVMIIYPYGKGRVIATTIYPDFSLKEETIDQNEINFVQNIITWAKKPATLLEVTPGKTATLNIDISNFADEKASSIKLFVLDPSRKTISAEVKKLSLKAGESITVQFSYPTTSKSTLGIYNVDYSLLDAEDLTLQPQAETDLGRFIISRPLKNRREKK